jgi:hypothetical protein
LASHSSTKKEKKRKINSKKGPMKKSEKRNFELSSTDSFVDRVSLEEILFRLLTRKEKKKKKKNVKNRRKNKKSGKAVTSGNKFTNEEYNTAVAQAYKLSSGWRDFSPSSSNMAKRD